MTILGAALIAGEIIAVLVVALVVGRFLGQWLVVLLEQRSRTACRSTDILRANDIVMQATVAYMNARDTRLTAEALERHVRGAAHV